MRLRGDQAVGVGMGGLAKNLGRRPLLDEAAHIHDGDLVADMAHHREIMGDDHIGEAELALKPRQEIEDLALDRDIEAGGRLIGDDELGIERDGAGDADAARLAARQLMRVAAGEILRQPDQRQQPPRLGMPDPSPSWP